MKKTIAVLPGDGVGPEVTEQAVRVLTSVAEIYGHTFDFKYGLIGAAAIDKTGKPYPRETHDLCVSSDAILFGAIGDPKYDNDPRAKVRPEQGLLKMRKSLGLYANLRPINIFSFLINQSPLKPEIVKNADFIVVRELTGGIYFGKKGRSANRQNAFDMCNYSKKEITRVTNIAFDLAKKRKQKVTLVDKANVLETSRLWRETVIDYAKKHPEIMLEMMFVDNAAMQIIKNPSQFDVILTDNMFGDILTDEASVIAGSLGMLPSASIGEKTAVYEPIHGSFSKAAGKNIANPTGAIFSAAMLLDYSFHLPKESKAINSAVKKTIEEGRATKDIMPMNSLATSDFTQYIIANLQNSVLR